MQTNIPCEKIAALTVHEFGQILYDGNRKTEEENAAEVQAAKQLLNALAERIKENKAKAFNTYLCSSIYPLYFLYRSSYQIGENQIWKEAQEISRGKLYPVVSNTSDEIEKSAMGFLKDSFHDWWNHYKETIPLEELLNTPLKKIPDALKDSLENVPAVFQSDSLKNKTTGRETYWWNYFLPKITCKEDKKSLSGPCSDRNALSPAALELITDIEQGISQIILTGAPGTGKTKAAKETAEYLSWGYELVQFHPSYDYTDFVEGLRPVQAGGELTFKKTDGTFKAFCREVIRRKDPVGKYIFIIDEINRADLSKVFGELMYCLEGDKRGKENKIPTQYQNLPSYDPQEGKERNGAKEDCFFNGFYIPENVLVIGTMNDIDRSVESMDLALRRRFLWLDVEVTEDLLTASLFKILGSELGGKVDQTIAKILSFAVMSMNEFLCSEQYSFYDLNKDYYISQGQFTGLPDRSYAKLNAPFRDADLLGFLQDAWNLRIRGLLKEYVRGEPDFAQFLEDCREKLLESALKACFLNMWSAADREDALDRERAGEPAEILSAGVVAVNDFLCKTKKTEPESGRPQESFRIRQGPFDQLSDTARSALESGRIRDFLDEVWNRTIQSQVKEAGKNRNPEKKGNLTDNFVADCKKAFDRKTNQKLEDWNQNPHRGSL